MTRFWRSFFLACLSLILAAIFFHIAYAQEQVVIPNITPQWITRQQYNNSTALVLSKGGKSSSAVQDNSFFSAKNLTIVPSAAGGLTIIAGSLFAWFKSKKRAALFREYMNQIENAALTYQQAKKNAKKKAFEDLKLFFTKTQEKADLSVADKKIDEDQGKTIVHTIERKLSEAERNS